MKNKKLLTALYIILMFLPLIAVVVAYPFLQIRYLPTTE